MLFRILFSSITSITSCVTLTKREAASLKFSDPAIITPHKVVIARYDAHIYNHRSNSTQLVYCGLQYWKLLDVLWLMFKRLLQFCFVLFFLSQEAFFGKDLLDTLGREKRSKHGGKTPSTPSEDEDRANQDPFAVRQGSIPPDRQQTTFDGSGQVPFQMVPGEERQHPGHSTQALHQTGFPRGSLSAHDK